MNPAIFEVLHCVLEDSENTYIRSYKQIREVEKVLQNSENEIVNLCMVFLWQMRQLNPTQIFMKYPHKLFET